MIPVVWLKAERLCWDQHLVGSYLSGARFSQHVDQVPAGADGAVVVVPARYFTAADVNAIIASLSWTVVVLTSDEESTFDWRSLSHSNMRLWVMTPHPHLAPVAASFLGEGCPADTASILGEWTQEARERPLDVFFAGQNTHQRRHDCLEAIRGLDCDVSILATEGFTQGLPRSEYLRLLASSKIAPCPSGPATPDSFRLYEALEAGCVPIADGLTPDPEYPEGYWSTLYGGVPFPVLTDWADLAKEVEVILDNWTATANRCWSWWQLRKRTERLRLHADIHALAGPAPAGSVDERVTVIIPTSPIPAHPSTDIIATTIASIRDRLPGAEILVVADGVRVEQTDRIADYDEYLRRILWNCAHEWTGVTPILLGEHLHQAGTTKVALRHVRAPLVLFVEHDTPLEGDIDWEACAGAIESGRANLIRFHHESQVLRVHRHLMLEDNPVDVEGAPLLRTVQWSQRPHLASTGFYRTIIDAHFTAESRTMIEDTMHSVLESAWTSWGEVGWAQFRTYMYAPEGNIRRSHHLDGRGADPKFEMQP